jgi:hypothetical protein
MAKNRTLAFLGFGGKKKAGEEGETDEEREAREQAEREKTAKAADDGDDGEDPDEEDEDEAKAESDEEKKAVRQRNALRAAGHRRGVSAAHVRVAAIVNGVAPAQAEMAMHLALNTDLTADQARATIAKAPKAGGGSSFARAMEHYKPAVGAGGGRDGKSPSLASRMAESLKGL